MLNNKQNDTIRKVAVLVASLDETWGERILSNLSLHEARLVRKQVEELTEIDPEEQQEVVNEFRRSLNQTGESASAGVEIEASLLQRIDHQDYAFDSPPVSSETDAINSSDAESLAEILSGESMQTVAVVLSRLETERAAAVLNTFSVEQQQEILNRLEQLDDADEHAVALVEAQINQWVAARQRRRERMAAGKQKVEQLLSRASVADKSGVVVAGKLPRDTTFAPMQEVPPAVRNRTIPIPVRYERMPALVTHHEPAPTNPFAHFSSSECLEQLEQLTDEVLLAALSRVENQVALCALVGTSEKFLKRVLRSFSWREAKRIRQRIRDIGPTKLSDILAAQQEILRAASEI